MSKERKFLNGLPLLIMLSINSRMPETEPFDCDLDGATVFEIENDIEDVTTVRPQQGTIDSTMVTLRDRGYVDRELVRLGYFQTYVHSLTHKWVNFACLLTTDKGKCRALGFFQCLKQIKAHKAQEGRHPRMSSPTRKRLRKKYDP